MTVWASEVSPEPQPLNETCKVWHLLSHLLLGPKQLGELKQCEQSFLLKEATATAEC